MDIRKVYFATRHNSGLKLAAIDALNFARKAEPWTYAKRFAESITTRAGNFFATTPTEYKRLVSAWNPEFTRDNSREKFRVLEDCRSNAALRFVGFADELTRLDHKGWYCDNFCHETMRGAVWQLPSRDGRPLYLAGYVEPWNDGGIVSMDIIRGDVGGTGDYNRTDDMTIAEAARIADGHAEYAAEEQREADTLYQAEQRIEDCKAEIIEARENHSDMIAELRSLPHGIESPKLCATIRASLASLREAVSELRTEIKRLTDEPWTINDGMY